MRRRKNGELSGDLKRQRETHCGDFVRRRGEGALHTTCILKYDMLYNKNNMY